MARSHELPTTYPTLLSQLKDRIRTARLKAALAVNSEMVFLYWTIGRDILEKQRIEHWGTKMIERLSRDLRSEFPGNRGLSPRNFLYMRLLAEAYPDERFVQQLVAQIPWGHNVVILDKIKEASKREWYIHKTIEYGWGRNTLVHYIEADLYKHQGKAITNFKSTLPKPDCDLAQQATKDEYNFDFLDTSGELRERQIERGLVDNICSFLLELGRGFAFMGSQYQIEVDKKDYYLDLLFYHVRLRCYVIIDLKATEFKPADAGQMNFYLSAVDALLRHPDDKPSIGLILCKENSTLTVEYALHRMTAPMGVAAYKVTHKLPDRLQEALPTPEELNERFKAALETAQQSEPEPKPKTRKQRK